MMKLLAVLAPMLGLLGTVTGMINAFDVMATLGSNNRSQWRRRVSAGQRVKLEFKGVCSIVCITRF